MLKFDLKDPRFSEEMLGLIPAFLSEEDPRPAREQIDANYQHGGGWSPSQGFRLEEDGSLVYPGDPALPVLAEAKLREEILRFYLQAWLVIMQPDGSWEVARID